MNYHCHATIDYTHWETPIQERTEIQAFSYFNLVKQLEDFYASYSGEFEVESVCPESGGKFSTMGLGRVEYDVMRMNQNRGKL